MVRPLECLNMPVLFYFVGERPLWYHICSYTTEFLGGCFLYAFIARLTKDKAVALAAAVMFLLYPTHDSTHYYIVMWDMHMSVSLFLASLWLFLKGIDEERSSLLGWSGACYFGSLFNYEVTLPLIALFPLLFMWRCGSPLSNVQTIRRFVFSHMPFVLGAVSLVLYRYWLLPSLHLGWNYRTQPEFLHFLSVIGAGVNVSLSPFMISFCASMIVQALKDGLSVYLWVSLFAAVGLIFFSLLTAQGPAPRSLDSGIDSDANELSLLSRQCAFLIPFGAVTLALSYTIFGLSAEHMPVIDAWLNRVNVCGSLGACLIIVGLLGVIKNSSVLGSKRRALFACAVALLAGPMIVVDWQFAKPWMVSWQAQRELMTALRNHASEIRAGDSIIIGGITRYVEKWAPVVDGVWDFENMVRTTLNNPNVNATVVTERLTLTDRAAIDRSGTLILGQYPFKSMILFSPQQNRWVRISSLEEFRRNAHQFGWELTNERGTQTTAMVDHVGFEAKP